MRYIIVFLMILTAYSCKRIEQNNDNKLDIKLYLDKDYYMPYSDKLNYEPQNNSINEKRFDVRFSILNNSDSVISFWTMTCDWQRSFLINNSYIKFLMPDECNHNYPHQISIKPHDSIQIKTTLFRDIQYDNPCKGCIGSFADQGRVQTTKIGLILINCTGDDDYFNWVNDKSKWNIIWSNSLYLRE
jgi:hypothetical protein